MPKITKCVCCAKGAKFVDLPAGAVSERWPGRADEPVCKCASCGAWYPQESVDESVRKDG